LRSLKQVWFNWGFTERVKARKEKVKFSVTLTDEAMMELVRKTDD